MNVRLVLASLTAFILTLSALLAQDRASDGPRSALAPPRAHAAESRERTEKVARSEPPTVVVKTDPESISGPGSDSASGRSFFGGPSGVLTHRGARAELTELELASSKVSRGADARFSNWARFPVGTWARFRSTSDVDENGRKINSVTEIKATLRSVDFERKRYTLEYDASVELGSSSLSRGVEVMEYDFWDIPASDEETEKDGAPTILMIGDRAVPCLVKRFVRQTGDVTEATTIWYSPVVAPYVMQRETIRTERGATISRELYVAQNTLEAEPFPLATAAYRAQFSASAGDRKVAGTSLHAQSVPGSKLVETLSDALNDPSKARYRAETTMLDYFIPGK